MDEIREKMAKTMGSNIKRLRKEANLKQSELAIQLGYQSKLAGVELLTKVERGKRFLPYQLVFPVADALGVPFYELFRDVDGWTQDTEKQVAKEFPLKETELEAVLLFRNLTQENKQKAIDYMRLLLFSQENNLE